MHCASLGEFEQGRPVIERMKKEWPSIPVVISFFSPSGFEIRKNYSVADKIIYLPVDTPKNAKKIIDEINPALVIWVKYEYWMNCLNELKKRKIPVLLIAGIFRHNQPFFKWYGRLWVKTLSAFEHLFVQNKESIFQLDKIGIKNASISGDTRFDRVIEIAEHIEFIDGIEKFKQNKKLIIAGSTWNKDEALLAELSNENPEINFIIVPHEIHQNNLNRIKKTFKNAAFFSDWVKKQTDWVGVNVLIVDSIGLLASIYKYADITYIGGGFQKGIHNTLEAAVYGKPIIFGPRYHKFAEAIELINKKGAFSVNNFAELKKTTDYLFSNKDILKNAGENSRRFVYSNKGATETIVNYVKLNRLLTN